MANNLSIVGDQLAEIATGAPDLMRFDLFSRSAFNRYYYSMFLTVRTTLNNIDCVPDKPNHINIREALTARVGTRLRQELKNQKGQLTAKEQSLIHNVATTVVNDLAQLLRVAYDVRCVADYHPEQSVDRTEAPVGASLTGCTISAAKSWQRRAESYTGLIQKAYKNVGLI